MHDIDYWKESLILLREKQLPFRRPTKSLDELLESAVDRRTKGLDVLVEVDCEKGALGDTFRSEFEFL